MSRIQEILRGFGGIFDISRSKADEPCLARRFYSTPEGSAADALGRDWELVTNDFLNAAAREIESVKSNAATAG